MSACTGPLSLDSSGLTIIDQTETLKRKFLVKVELNTMTAYTLQIEHCITLGTNSTVTFLGTDEGDWGSILVDNTVFRVQINEDGDLLWDKDGFYQHTFTSSGESITITSDARYLDITYTGLVGINHTFSVEIQINACDRYSHMDSHLTSELLDPLIVENASPSGLWSDFNEWHNTWRVYRKFSSYSDQLICPDDLPDEPKLEDY